MSKPPQVCEPFGIIAGAGEYPMLMLRGAKQAGKRVIGAGFKGAVSREFAEGCDEFKLFRVGAVDGPLDFLLEHGVTQAVMTGQLKPSCIYTMWPDQAARSILAKLDRRNAHSIFGGVCAYAKERGIQVLPSTTYLDEHMPPEGLICGPPLSPEQLQEAKAGMRMAREIARLDIGQSLIVHQGRAICVEAFKGTNECIAEGGYRNFSPILCKLTKAGHDMRFDVPCVGIGTVKHCERAGIHTIVIEANKTMLLQAEEVRQLCEQAGISIYALPYPHDEDESPRPWHEPMDDAEHARMLARELSDLGIGHSAVVCDGVVIAVGDCEGAEKCLHRAARYMKRLRFARLTNWLCRVLLGHEGRPPQPMVMANTKPWTPSERKLAKRSHIKLF